MQSQQLSLPSGLRADVLVEARAERPLIFLHNHLGRAWDDFLEALSADWAVYAPQLPGIEIPEELEQLDRFSDLAFYYDDLLTALELDEAVVVGHGFGGMVAAELAALSPGRVSRLVLIDSLGLWRDDLPIPDISSIPQAAATEMLTGSADLTKSLLAPPSDPAERGAFIMGRYLAQAAVSHFIWPIPDRDLRRRLYRLVMPTLVVWGANDAYVPVAYAQEFTAGLPDARSFIVEGAGHMPHLEKTAEVVKAISDFTST